MPPSSAFGKNDESGGKATPVLVKLSALDANRQRYAIIAHSGMNQHRQPGSPAYIYLEYWIVDTPDNGSLVCDFWSGKVDKVLVPVTEEPIRETGGRMEEEIQGQP